jgi:phosphoserine phosphatase
MAGLISVRAGPRSSLPIHRPSAARSPLTPQVAVQFTNPLFRSAKVCKSRSLVAAALEVSKDGGSAVLDNRQPSKGRSFFSLLPKASEGCLR